MTDGGPAGRLIGRERELVAIRSALADARLVTLTGPGGVGKTALARVVAGPDSCLAALATVDDEDAVVLEVARAVGAEVAENLLGAAVEALGSRLLVLDSCERVLSGAAAVVAAGMPGPVLATSRTPLGVPGEVVIVVQPLEPADAATLYVERSGRPPGEGLAELCRRLDHLPLALELAAGWATVLTPAELATRLDDRFRLLDEGDDQPSLRAAIRTSWDLLDDADQAVLAALATFAAPFDLAAAEAVAGAGVLPALRRMSRASLVQVDQGGASTRYALLESIRDFARDELDASGAASEVRCRHLAHFTAVAEAAEHAAAGGLVRSLASSVPDFAAALQWGLVDAPSIDGAHLAVAMRPLWQFLGMVREGRHWLSQALAISLPPSDRARVANALANFHVMARQLDAAEPLYLEALELRRGLRNDQAVAHNLVDLSVLRLHQGSYGDARAALEEALALLASHDDDFGVGACLVNLGSIEMLDGDPQRALERFTEARVACLRIGQPFMIAVADLNLAVAALGVGRLTEASQHLGAGLPVLHAGGHRIEVLGGLEVAGALAERRGMAEHAVWLLAATEGLRQEWGIPASPAEVADLAAVATRARAAVAPLVATEAGGAGRAASIDEVVAKALELSSAAPSLRRQGPVWEVTFAGRSVAVPDSKGLADLAELLRHPGREVEAVALASPTPEAFRGDRGSGPSLDDQARRAYRRRISELEVALDEADRRGDAEASRRAQDELDVVARELAAATRLGGRARGPSDAASERARKAVTKRLRTEIARVGALHPELGAHLQASVQTGLRCTYAPQPAVAWDVSTA